MCLQVYDNTTILNMLKWTHPSDEMIQQLHERLNDVVEQLQKHPESKTFLVPIDMKKYPDFKEVFQRGRIARCACAVRVLCTKFVQYHTHTA